VRRRFREGDVVCNEGDFGSTAFYIVSGHVDIYLANPLARVQTKPGGAFSAFKRMTSFLKRSDDSRVTEEQGFIPIDASVDLPRTTPLAWLGPGELFGEMTCRTFQPRSATVRATEDCVMVEMLRVILDMLLGTRDPDAATKATTKVKAPTFKGTSFKKLMDDRYRERSLVAHLRSVPLFATLDLDFFNYLKDKAELISCDKGQIICKQGEPADAFYLIRSGLVRVAESMPGGEMVRTYRKRGEYFGEAGLIFDQPRAATCSALDAVDLVKISKDAFHVMLGKFPVVRATLEKVGAARLESMKEKKLPVGLKLDEFLNQGLFEAQNLLLIDLDNCTRCDACVNACADAHDGVTRLIRDGLRYDRFLVATACRSCRDPLCMTQCPVGSIRRKESLEIIIEDWCIGCTKCAELCPYGNINMVDFKMTKAQLADLERKEREKEVAKKAADAKAAAEKAAKAAAPPAPKPADATASPAAAATPAEPKTASPTPAGEPAKPPVAKPVAAAAPKPTAPAVATRVKPPAVKKAKDIVVKATTCDLCTDLSVPSCVYACPHDAAKRVDPTQFLSAQIGRGGTGQRFRWLPKRSEDRTTH
jgi:CRP-like cAMP-binding protein/Fe-S-cluster-containing hydrogenase component 2